MKGLARGEHKKMKEVEGSMDGVIDGLRQGIMLGM